MSAKKDLCAPVKLSPGDLREHKNHPRKGQPRRNTRGGVRGRSKQLPERFQEQYRASKERQGRLALKDIRANWFEAVDHDEINQQLWGDVRVYQARV